MTGLRVAVVGTRGVLGVQGGIETYCRTVYPLLAERGCDVVVYTRRPYAASPREYRGVALVPLWAPRRRSTETVVHTTLAVLAAGRRRPDVVHFHAVGPSLLVPLARLLGLPVVVRHVGADYRRAKWGPAARLALRLGERLGVRYATEVVCISEEIAEDVRARLHREVTVIPNAVTLPEPQPDGTRERLGLAPGRYVLAVGRLVPEKAFHLLVEAAAALAGTGWKIVIAGGGEGRYARSLEEQAAGRDEVVLAGMLGPQALDELYRDAGLFVLPSTHEGLSFAALEALAHGVPALVSDIPANRALGLGPAHVFVAGDARLLAASLARAVGSQAVRDGLAAGSREAARRFRSDVLAERTHAVLARAAATRGAP